MDRANTGRHSLELTGLARQVANLPHRRWTTELQVEREWLSPKQANNPWPDAWALFPDGLFDIIGDLFNRCKPDTWFGLEHKRPTDRARARALEYGFENAWRDAEPGCSHCDGERFAADFRATAIKVDPRLNP